MSQITGSVPVNALNKRWPRTRVPESIPTGSCIFLSDPDPDAESKICEKTDRDPESFFNFGSSRSLRGYFLNKNMGKYRLDRL